jgi:hypothetical protein
LIVIEIPLLSDAITVSNNSLSLGERVRVRGRAVNSIQKHNIDRIH